MIHARHQYQPMRHFSYGGVDYLGRDIWTPKPRRRSRANGNHKRDDPSPRPPEGTVLPLTGWIVGPDPSTCAGRSDLGRPLAARRPELFNGTWRPPLSQKRLRDEDVTLTY